MEYCKESRTLRTLRRKIVLLTVAVPGTVSTPERTHTGWSGVEGYRSHLPSPVLMSSSRSALQGAEGQPASGLLPPVFFSCMDKRLEASANTCPVLFSATGMLIHL